MIKLKPEELQKLLQLTFEDHLIQRHYQYSSAYGELKKHPEFNTYEDLIKAKLKGQNMELLEYEENGGWVRYTYKALDEKTFQNMIAMEIKQKEEELIAENGSRRNEITEQRNN